MKIIRQQFYYLLDILVITVEASILILARDAVLNGDVQLVYVPTMKQIADGLTTPLCSMFHQTFCEYFSCTLRYEVMCLTPYIHVLCYVQCYSIVCYVQFMLLRTCEKQWNLRIQQNFKWVHG
jgi:hypothetical protein